MSWRWGVGLVLLWVGTAHAQEELLQRADELVQESGEDWNAKNYADGALKLRVADAILEQTAHSMTFFRASRASYFARRTEILRRLIWNEMMAGESEQLLLSWSKLLVVVARERENEGEARSAYRARRWHPLTSRVSRP